VKAVERAGVRAGGRGNGGWFQITLRSNKARPLTNHVQSVLRRTTLPEDVTVVFDMDAYNFS